jgi:hypothetical protein
MPLNILPRIGDLPAAQHGYFTRAQASAAGIEDFELTRSVNYGFIDRVGHGVYRVAGAGYDPLADLRVAWLRLDPANSPRQRMLRPDIWVSHESAAAVHGLGVFIADEHTFISTRRLQPGPGIRIRRHSGGLARTEWTTKDGFAVTTVERTAADLFASGADGGHIGRFLLDALNAGLADPEEIQTAMRLKPENVQALLEQAGSIGRGS